MINYCFWLSVASHNLAFKKAALRSGITFEDGMHTRKNIRDKLVGELSNIGNVLLIERFVDRCTIIFFMLRFQLAGLCRAVMRNLWPRRHKTWDHAFQLSHNIRNMPQQATIPPSSRTALIDSPTSICTNIWATAIVLERTCIVSDCKQTRFRGKA